MPQKLKNPSGYQAANLLAAIVSSSDDAIIGKSADGVITSWNASAERIFGYTADEVLGRPVSVLAAPGREDEMPELLQRIHRGERIDHFETERRHKNGSIVFVSLTVSPILDETGAVIGASKIARDITLARKAADALALAEARLEARNRELLHASRLAELGQMAATLAHEINQPLAATLNYLQGVQTLLTANALTGSNQISMGVNAATKQTVRAGEIVRRLKEFARPGSIDLQPEPIDDVVHEAVALMEIDARKYGIEIDVEGSSDGCIVWIDRVEIQQVIINLLRNALDAIEHQPDKEVSVLIRRSPSIVEVCIRDNGPGIASSVREQIFEAFFSTKPSGLGLGLSICQKILARHNGAMEIGELSPTGVEFSFRLAVQDQPELQLVSVKNDA